MGYWYRAENYTILGVSNVSRDDQPCRRERESREGHDSETVFTTYITAYIVVYHFHETEIWSEKIFLIDTARLEMSRYI